MSTLKVDNLLNAAGNESPISVPGAAKAWVNFNGTGSSATIRDSFNVSSVTDNAVGDYTMTFTNSMNNSNYCIQVSATDDGTGSNMADGYAYGGWKRGANSVVFTTASARIKLGYPTNTNYYDLTHIMVAFFGD
jgi:hypothetical protein